LVGDVELHTGAAYVIMEHKSSLYRRILLSMVGGESRARRGNILRRVPVALWRTVCKCFVKSSLESRILYFLFKKSSKLQKIQTFLNAVDSLRFLA
jgi:hypothetical protein